MGFGLRVGDSSFLLLSCLAQDSTQIYLQPPSSLGVASFLPKGEVVSKSESQELQQLRSFGGVCGWAGGLEGPIRPGLWIQLSQ